MHAMVILKYKLTTSEQLIIQNELKKVESPSFYSVRNPTETSSRLQRSDTCEGRHNFMHIQILSID